MSIILKKEHFEPYLNQNFNMKGEGVDGISLELNNITDSSNDDAYRFEVVFIGPKEPMLPQMVYTLVHEEMGEINLFLVPFAVGKYEAVFNYLKEQ